MKARRFALAPAAALLISAAPPQDAASTADFQCLIASFAVVGMDEDKKAAEGGMIMSLYYLGKIDGRFPGFNLEPAVKAAAERLTDAELPALIARCADEFGKRGEYLSAMGQRLGTEEKK
jgi:hypothetical protein